MHLIIITGLSGSGKHSAIKVLEDIGYSCVDNLPIKLLPTFVELYRKSEGNFDRAALVLDVREPNFINEFPGIFSNLNTNMLRPMLLFFEASDDVLIRRFSETRRPHPVTGQIRKKTGLLESIAEERRLLSPIRELADNIVDTSGHTVHTLRPFLLDMLKTKDTHPEMKITIMSFGFKHGIPPESDIVLDVRFLKNPHFIPELRLQTGRQKPVIDFLIQDPEVIQTIDYFKNILNFVLPRYVREGRSYLTISIGCTGGRHRSVMIAEKLNRNFKKQGFNTRVKHRDIAK